MRNVLKPILGVCLPALVLAVVFFAQTRDSSAQVACSVALTKIAPGASADQFFFFSGEIEPSGSGVAFVLQNQVPTFIGVNEDTTMTVFESETDDFRFEGLICETNSGVSVTQLEGGFSIECSDAANGLGNCTIRNSAISHIPTLSEWGMIAAAGAMLVAGAYYAMRRRRLSA